MPEDGTTESSPAPVSSPAPQPPAGRRHPEGNIKDTVESILVAFILAFVFRAFVVEAFVIPTGSMAPTLLGAHMQFRCNDCGYDFTVNHPTRQVGSDLSIPPASGAIGLPIYCPNCGYLLPETDRTGVPVHYGDRILVLKYRYLLSEPSRWDVVVFKAPEPVPPAPNYTTNYIKRLVGRPGESVVMIDGDIYVSTATPPARDADDAQQDAFLRTFKVQRKPPHAQDAVWRVVYDNDFVPHLTEAQRSGDPWTQPWTPERVGTGWDVGQKLPAESRGRTRILRFDNASTGGAIRFDATANRDTHAFTDFLAYDQYSEGNHEYGRPIKNTVTDLKLTCLYDRQAGEGPIDFELEKRGERFTARLTPGQAMLIRTETRTGREIARYGPVNVSGLAGAGRGAVRVDFSNVDYRVALRIDGNEVLATGDDDYGPTGDALVALEKEESSRGRQPAPPPAVRIVAEKQTCTLSHVSLWRDIFYINRNNSGAGGERFHGSPGSIISLGAEEYFVLGDNSFISGDARGFKSDVVLPGEGLPFVAAGRVPARFMLGKAFFVYWPAGHRPLNSTWGLIPNFGEMRFIR